jgi:hypothetical protein
MIQGAICDSANKRAIELMNARGLEAATLILDVQTGALVAFAATPASNAAPKGVGQLNVTTPVLDGIGFTPPKIPGRKEKGQLGTKTNIDAATQL